MPDIATARKGPMGHGAAAFTGAGRIDPGRAMPGGVAMLAAFNDGPNPLWSFGNAVPKSSTVAAAMR